MLTWAAWIENERQRIALDAEAACVHVRMPKAVWCTWRDILLIFEEAARRGRRR